MTTEAQYLIIKRGLYYRPNSQGYTGLKDEAGRYPMDRAESITHPNGLDGPRDGMSFIHEDDAPDYAPQCCTYVKADHLQKKLAEMQERDRQWVAECKSLMEKGLAENFTTRALRNQLADERALSDRFASVISGEAVGIEWKRETMACIATHKLLRRKYAK